MYSRIDTNESENSRIRNDHEEMSFELDVSWSPKPTRANRSTKSYVELDSDDSDDCRILGNYLSI